MVAIVLRPSMPPNAPLPLAPQSAPLRPTLQAKPPDDSNVPVNSVPPLIPLSKIRPRRERPCDACRQRKTRCVTNQGETVCGFCKLHNKECTFVQKPTPRKRKLPDDHKNVDAETRDPARRKPSVDARDAAGIKQEDSATARGISGSSEQDETGSESSQIPFDPSDMSLLGQTTLDFDVLSLLDFDQRQTASSTLGSIRRNEGAYMLVSSDQSNKTASSNANDVKEIETVVGDYGAALIDAYFHFVHPNLPIINEHHFRKLLAEKPSSCSSALLAGIYILGIGFWDHHEELASRQKPDVSKLETIASRSIDNFNGPRSLSTIQAGLLLSHSAYFESWARTAHLIAVAQDVGLHLDCSQWTIPRWERRLRKRVAWALYVQDKWAALIHGRPSHIYNNDWAVQPLTSEDFDDSEDAPQHDEADHDPLPTGYIMFEQLVALTSITSEILETFYTRRAFQEITDAQGGGTRLVLGQAKPLQMKLKDWFTALPAAVKLDNDVEDHVATSSIGSLHLAYYATEMTLHRRIISSLSSSSSSTPAPTSQPSSTPSSPSKHRSPAPSKLAEPSSADSYLTHIIRTAAKTRLISALDFANRLRPAHLYSFWHFYSPAAFALIGSFGSLLQATAPAQEEVEFYKARLREYRWTLGVSAKWAKACGSLEEAVERLDALTQVLERAPSKPSLYTGSAAGDLPGMDGYHSHRFGGGAMDIDGMSTSLPISSTTGMAGIPRPEFYGSYPGDMHDPSNPMDAEGSSPTESSAALSMAEYDGTSL